MKEIERYNLLTGLIQVDLKNGKYIEHSVHLKEVEQLQARIKELEMSTIENNKTIKYLTSICNRQPTTNEEECKNLSWNSLKIDCGLNNLTAGEEINLYCFFSQGWLYASKFYENLKVQIKELESQSHINEIKAQGISEAIKGFRTFALSNNVNLTCEDFDEYLCEQVKKLRTKHE